MENEHPYRRNAFDMYKELKIYFVNRVFEVIDYNNKGTVMSLPFLWVKISSRGVIVKEKRSGKEIHFKYSSIDSVHDGALKCEDVELYTPFIKENDTIKFITWEEWNEKYNTEEICKRITSVTDEHLKEHNTDLMYILDKLCSCAGHPNFDHPHRFIKVEPRYQDNEYSLHRVAADFKWHYGAKVYDYISYTFEYEAKNRTIHIDIKKDETWYTPCDSFVVLPNHIPLANQVDAYSIDVEFNKDYSVSKVTVKNKNKENLLKFMEMGNPVIKNTIRQIRDYINAKLTEKQLTSRINTSTEDNMFVQAWNFSPRVDVHPNTDSIRKANERAKAYNIFDFNLNKHGDIYSQIKKEAEWIFDHPKTSQTCAQNKIDTCSGYVLTVSSGTLLEATREKIHFQFEHINSSFRRITIEVLDPNRQKLRITIGVEGSELVSIAVYPSFDNFEAVIGTIHNQNVKRLISEIFNKLYKGEE